MVEMGLDPDVDIELAGRLNEVNPDAPELNSAENQDLILLAGIPGVLEARIEDLLNGACSMRA